MFLTCFLIVADIHWKCCGFCQPLPNSSYLWCWDDWTIQGKKFIWAASTHVSQFLV